MLSFNEFNNIKILLNIYMSDILLSKLILSIIQSMHNVRVYEDICSLVIHFSHFEVKSYPIAIVISAVDQHRPTL